MKATELRIGNYAEHNGNYLKIESLVKNESWVIDRGDGLEKINLSDISPILLTLEVLEKCGFKKSDYEPNVYSLNSFDIVYTIGYQEREPHWHYGHDYEKGDGMSGIWKAINYLHQLQNLYFSMTGEELEINL